MKIIRTRAKIKDINIKFFYKLLLNIKSLYICCIYLHIKTFKEPPSERQKISRDGSATKNIGVDWPKLRTH